MTLIKRLRRWRDRNLPYPLPLKAKGHAMTAEELERKLIAEISKVPGGYIYENACSVQYCFPLAAGGELRFMLCEDDDAEPYVCVDHYDGSLPPGISGVVHSTGNSSN